MAGRGIEIHNGKVVLPSGNIEQLSLGTWGAPIAQSIAAQIMVGAVIEAVAALGGDIHGGYFGARVEVAYTGTIRGLRARASVLSNVALTGSLYGIHTEIELGGATSTISGVFVGHTIEMYTEAGNVITGDVYGIHVNNYNLATVGVYMMMRLEENGTAIPDAIIGIYVNDATYFIHLTPAVPAAGGWTNVGDRTAGSATNAAGWLLVDHQGADKYIQLFD